MLSNIFTSSKSSNEEYSIVRDNIAHAIISAIRPRTFISNLQLALGTYIYRKTGSKLIIDIISKLGMCASYYTIQLYEASTIMNSPGIVLDDDVFVQHVFDNTDHNVSTLDGRRSFHCLGGISVYTPGYAVDYGGSVKKCNSMPSASELASKNSVNIVPYNNSNVNGLKNIKYINISELRLEESVALPPSYTTCLWAKYFNIPNIPSWKGFVEVLSEDVSYSVSNITCLPFINQPPSNLTTINTALHNAVAECTKLNQKTCFVTFDQPLYIKARSIVAASEGSSLQNVIVRLGGFHLLMSYLGAIGHVMNGSGLEDLWSVIYAPESVKKMITCSAFARSMRAHILTFTALGTIICKSIDPNKKNRYYRFLTEFLGKWDSEPPLIGDCRNSDIEKMTTEFLNQLHTFRQMGPTSQLWVQYFECVVVAVQFIEAERLGDWKLHLQSVQKMLPLFHASGHIAYAKCAQIYLQEMANLECVMDDVEYHKFTTEGYFTIR